jgi:PAS domain S-box-containing protein
MNNAGNKSDPAMLRQKAEELLKKKLSKSASEYSESESIKLIHELEVHQIELEMQNEELMRARFDAQDAAEKYTELYDFAPSGYFTLSQDGKIIELNLSGAKMLGKERSFLKNSRFGFFVSNDTKPIFNLFLGKAFNSNAKESCEVVLSADGNLPMYAHLTGIVPENGEQCLMTVHDISANKQIEEELKLKNDLLIKANAEKEKFFSIIAHDLRNPFNGFLGLTKIMAEELSDLTMDEIKEIAISMRNSASNLFRLLENLLLWSRIQQGLIPFNPEVVQLLPIINEIMAIVVEPAKKKEIEITYNIPDDIEVFADCNILNTVILNIVSNAVKFTHKGGKITISAQALYDGSVEISVMDTGIGMSPEMVENLFRFDVSTNRIGTEGEPSTGLGLLLCKEFMVKHGGTIYVKSEEGKSSTFYLTIPPYGNYN